MRRASPARANLMGELSLSWDDERVDRQEILGELGRAGFHPARETSPEPAGRE
jgi:hypothetical protein